MGKFQTLINQLRDIGDALRTTNLVRGREIRQLADDLETAHNRELQEEVHDAIREAIYPEAHGE